MSRNASAVVAYSTRCVVCGVDLTPISRERERERKGIPEGIPPVVRRGRYQGLHDVGSVRWVDFYGSLQPHKTIKQSG